ncbi:MAG: hypothetical protein HY537_13080 [Deltaproteobacteria bacterium]|nr:hypothetical protein [Deltaproteobacteria bacterium]
METRMNKNNDNLTKNNESRNRRKKGDRIHLTKDVLARVDGWISQIESSTKAVQLTRSDLVNFILLAHQAVLSDDEIVQLKDLHFDAFRFAKWIAQCLKEAKLRGQNVSQQELLRLYTNGQKHSSDENNA